MTKPLKIGIIAGEASGDLLGASLISALKEQYPGVEVEGIGGKAMQAVGCHSLFDMERLSVMGFIEPLKRLPDLLRLRRGVIAHFQKNRPDIFIGIDAPDFNLGIERKLHDAGIKTVHYVSPSVWAWRQYRIHKIAKAIDLMLTLLPFEATFYEKHQVPVNYVGHPLADSIPLNPDKNQARSALGLSESDTYVALLPGSRKQELAHLLETYLRAAKLIQQQKPEVKFISAQANHKRYQEFIATWKEIAPELPLTVFEGKSHQVLAAADTVIVTSGTATLEAMLYKKPMVIAYRTSPLVYYIARWLVKTPYIGLPNILANELLVPELIQDAATPETIASITLNYLNNPEKVRQLEMRYTELHQALRLDSSRQAAMAILQLVLSS